MIEFKDLAAPLVRLEVLLFGPYLPEADEFCCLIGQEENGDNISW